MLKFVIILKIAYSKYSQDYALFSKESIKIVGNIIKIFSRFCSNLDMLHKNKAREL